MPSRQISPESFDHILRDLGDDPAIQDPHGIRKTQAPKQSHSNSQNPGWPQPNLASSSALSHFLQSKIRAHTMAFGALLLASVLAGYWGLNIYQDGEKNRSEEFQSLLLPLQKKMAALEQIHDDEIDVLYEEIDKLEVSVHSLRKIKPNSPAISKPKAPTYEPELRRWRYLGNSQMEVSQQAFFLQGRTPLMLAKGDVALGDWRLSHIENEAAIFSHPDGKSLTLKVIKSE